MGYMHLSSLEFWQGSLQPESCLLLLVLKTDRYAAISLYTFLGLGYDGLACLATSMVDLEIALHFDKPFFSESSATCGPGAGTCQSATPSEPSSVTPYKKVRPPSGCCARREDAGVMLGSCRGHA